jgi:phenylacetic acid degradation protein paaN
VNTVVVESTDQYAAMLQNLAFSLCLYSGQMCTTTQNLLVPREGIRTDEGHKSFEQFGQDLAAAVDKLASNPKIASSVLGAIVSKDVWQRVDAAQGVGRTLLASRALPHPDFPEAQARTPVLVALDQADASVYRQECFGPVSYLVATDSAAAAADLAESVIREHGALTLGVYSTDEAFIERMETVGRRARVALSVNLTQGVYVNQAAAFSDYHGSGGNPAANASYTTLAFVADRFVVVQRRRHV